MRWKNGKVDGIGAERRLLVLTPAGRREALRTRRWAVRQVVELEGKVGTMGDLGKELGLLLSALIRSSRPVVELRPRPRSATRGKER